MLWLRNNKKFRHELKYLITEAEAVYIESLLKLVMVQDSHAVNGEYFIRSQYFDDRNYSSYHDKNAGTNLRKKYRIRIYDNSDKVIKLECKEKNGQYIYKTSAGLNRHEYDSIIKGDYEFLKSRTEQVCKDMYIMLKCEGLKPVVLVDYNRKPYIYKHGDVRITFDRNVRGSFDFKDVFDTNASVHEVLPNPYLIMEVKFTEYLPAIISDLLCPYNSIYTQASKYVMCIDKDNELQGII